jgi:hypothetical protein
MARRQGRKKTPLKDLKARTAKAAKVKGGGAQPDPFKRAGIEPVPFKTSRDITTR